jgi:hypothetical protein
MPKQTFAVVILLCIHLQYFLFYIFKNESSLLMYPA